MNCTEFQKNIYRRLDGKIDEGLKEKMAGHSGSCPSCCREFEMAGKLNTALCSAGENVEPSRDFEASFWRKVYARKKKPWLVRIFDELEPFIPVPTFAQAFAALFLAFFIGSAGGILTGRTAIDIPLAQTAASYFSQTYMHKGNPPFSLAGIYLKMIEEGRIS